MAAAEWWATFFDGAALATWRLAHSREEDRAEARGIEGLLGLRPGAEVLDAPCGDGRLALALAARGHHVVGLDASTECLALARDEARRLQLELGLEQGDLRALPWHERFDAALCAGNSFGLFDDAGNAAFLRGVARALRPGGRLLLEYPLLAELLDARPLGRDWQLFGERLLLTEAQRDARTGRLEVLHTFLDLARPGAREERAASYRVLALSELEALARASGLRVEARLGSLAGEPFGAEAEAFYLLASRA
ncbi:MAG TPA: class I SAM-dependent methyltransferase [Planctomycetota bacterium]